AFGGGVLPRVARLAHVTVRVFGQFVGRDDAVAVLVGLALQSFYDIVSENTVPAAPIRAFIRRLAVAAGGQREERSVQIEQAAVEGRVVGCDGAVVAGVGHQPLVGGVDAAADDLAERLHGIAGAGNVLGVQIVRREIRFAAENKSVAGKVDEDAVFWFGNVRQPLL